MMSIRQRASLLLIIGAFASVSSTWGVGAASVVSAVVAQAELSVNALAIQAEELHKNRCELLAECQCTTPGCAQSWSAADGFDCSTKFGQSHSVEPDEAEGALAECTDHIRGLNTSVVRLPMSTYNTAATEEFVCASRQMEPTFVANYGNGSGNLTAWQYAGHSDGGIRLYPGSPQDNGDSCAAYDSRLRPWYLAAASGPRDIVIIIDTSGSMEDNNRMSLVRCATNSLLSTLTFADYVDVVSFSSSETSHGGGLLQATEVNINALKGSVNNLEPEGATFFNAAFTSAFSSLTGSTRGSNCQKVILFLTDGVQGDSGTIAHIQNLRSQTQDTVHIFTFAMGIGAGHDILKAIACDNVGAFDAVTDGTNPLETMSAYYKFLAAGIQDNTVRWTEPYVDAFGMGTMVTASRAVYDRSSAVPLLVGVVGTDITTDTFVEEGQALLSSLLERTTTCPTFSISTCQMQLIRQAETGYFCPSQSSPSACTEEISPLSCPTTSRSGTTSRFCAPSQVGSTLQNDDFTCCAGATCGASNVFGRLSMLPTLLLTLFLLPLTLELGAVV